MLEQGTVLNGQYEILDIIGRGGQSRVYRARRTKVSSGGFGEVAIKEMRRGKDFVSDMVNMDLVRQEVLILSRMSHPCLPGILGIFEHQGNLYVAEEYIEGITLEEHLKEMGQLDIHETLEIAIKMAEVLDFLHHQNPPVYYRDLKPSNIIMNKGNVYLVDYSGCYIPNLAFASVAIRSKGYSPPEAYTSTTADAAFDVYTLGMLIYRMITGVEVASFGSHAPALDAKKDGVHPSLVKIVNRAIQENKMNRYHTVWEMKMNLEIFRARLRTVSGIKTDDVNDFFFPFPLSVRENFSLIMDLLVGLLPVLLIVWPWILEIYSLHSVDKFYNPILYLVALLTVCAHTLFHHWLDWVLPVGYFNRFLHKPIKGMPMRMSLVWLVLLADIAGVVYSYIMIFSK